jgi:hypothetical protein
VKDPGLSRYRFEMLKLHSSLGRARLQKSHQADDTGQEASNGLGVGSSTLEGNGAGGRGLLSRGRGLGLRSLRLSGGGSRSLRLSGGGSRSLGLSRRSSRSLGLSGGGSSRLRGDSSRLGGHSRGGALSRDHRDNRDRLSRGAGNDLVDDGGDALTLGADNSAGLSDGASLGDRDSKGGGSRGNNRGGD